MALNKIDNKIREKLVSREIKPSAQAWDRLDAMLSIVEKEEPKKTFGIYKYIGIAASLVLFVTLGFWMYKNNSDVIIENTIIKQEKTAHSKQDTLRIYPNNVENQLLINEEIIVENEVVERNNKLLKENILNNETIVIVENTLENTNSKSDENQRDATIEEGVTVHKYMTAEKLLASIENREAEKNEIKEKVTKATIKVNTNSLLTDIESELDLEFRESKIDKVTKKFHQIKSALANRNHE